MIRLLQAVDLSYFKGNFFLTSDDGTQNYLVFQQLSKYFKSIIAVGNGEYIYYWKSRGFYDERINSIIASDHVITPELSYYGDKTRVKFNGSRLKQDKIGYTHKTIVNIYIFYDITKNNSISSYPALDICLFGEIRLTETPDIDK